jgi:hypothetical protein
MNWKLIVIGLLNIPICFVLYGACLLFVVSYRIQNENFLIAPALVLHAFINYKILKNYSLISRKSILMSVVSIIITWAVILAINMSDYRLFP